MATVYAEEIIVTPEISQIELGQSIQLTATVLPENAVNKQIEWSSDDSTYSHANRVSVDQNGLVRGNSVGSGYVNVYTKMVSTRVSKRLDIEVVNPENAILVNRIVISPSSLTLRLGETTRVTATVSPNNATCKDVFWSAPQGAVTTIDQQGNVTASKVGGSRIIARSADGNAEAWISVTVTDGDSDTPSPPIDEPDYVTFTMPTEVEVERGQEFPVWVRGFEAKKRYNNVFSSYFSGKFEFTPLSSQIQMLSVSSNDTSQREAWFKAGEIPGNYEIKVEPKFESDAGYGTTIVKVRIVDKIFNDNIVRLTAGTSYICFRDDDVTPRPAYGEVPNPYRLRLGWVGEGETYAKNFTADELKNIGWHILNDGIVSKIEYDGNYLKIYRGSEYGITQAIFYLKSNPHIYFPIWIEWDGGNYQYYLTDGGRSWSTNPEDPTPITPDDPTPVNPDDPTPVTPDDPTPVDPVQYDDDVITYIKRVGDEYVIEKQYVGNLNFKTGGFFDSIVDYETENLSKVYWVDGVNQPRVITLEDDWSQYDDTSFDFVPEIDKFPHVYIEKEHTSGAGIFKAGIVQYFFTYSNIHGVETAVVYSSPLFYADHRKRAGAPDDFVECQFNISISNLSQKFDKINVYRAIRTSVNTEVEMVKIANIDITGDSTSIIDDYVGGQAVSPTDLFFKGGDRFVAGTLAAKDNTLFLGNIDLDIPDYSELKSVLDDIYPAGFGEASTMKQLYYVDSNAFLNGNREITYTQGYSSGNYFHSSNSYLKNGDYYNIGIQLQDKYGKWSEPILFDDFLMPSGRPSNGRIPKQLLEVNIGHMSNSIKNKYKRIRAVACFPNENKRNFIAQGVLNPSVYCSKDRNENRPYAMSSWFFRSIPRYLNNNPIDYEDTTLEYRHDRILGYNNHLNCEIQIMDPFIIEQSSNENDFILTGLRITDLGESALERILISNLFAIDSSICTLNSPDITDVGTDQESCNVSIVGYFNTNRVVSEYNISMATASRVTIGGFSNITDERIFKGERQNPLSTWPLYFDSFTYYMPMAPQEKLYTQDTGVAWAVYPWQADRPLGNDYDENNTTTFVRGGTNTNLRGQYSKKILGNIRYCGDTNYMTISNNIDNISDVNYYRSIASGLTRILSEDNTGSRAYNYYSVVDKIFTGYSSRESGLLKNNLYILRYANGTNAISPVGTRDDAVPYADFISSNRRKLFNNYSGAHTETYDIYTLIAQEPVLIRYKSSPHAVFKINPRYDSQTGEYIERVLPGYLALEQRGDSQWPSIWNGCVSLESAIPELFNHQELENTDRYWMGELTRDTNPEQMFPLDINDREFVPISDIYDFSGSALSIELYGDIHYQRWDCLKTYPYSYDDKNQVIDVLSFMVESKINLDGRYDKYVETEDVTIIDDSFFNKIDDVYNQKDNFFTYRIQEDWLKENNSFPNQFAWSQTKHPGEEIDTWTSVNLASTYQADGSLGEIRKIIKFGDSLFCFQDKGISQIMFNSNIQLSASSGVPIELANSGKVDGVRYITNMEGCINPWTIKAGLVGIYFVDDINHSLDKLAADGIHRLSENKGFSDFVHRGHSFRTTWYDNEKKDVHFVTGNQTLCYSEKMDEFTSFYDYGRANIAFNVGDNWNQMYGYDNDLFTARRGDYFYFFDDAKPSTFSVTYRVAPQPFNYKIFNTVDYLLRVNSVDGINHDLTYNSGFHEISVSTENGDVTHRIDKSDFTQNMNQIKKFNIWRTNIPRFDYFRRADGTSMYLCLRAGKGKDGVVYDNNLSNKRYELHNLKISYLS